MYQSEANMALSLELPKKEEVGDASSAVTPKIKIMSLESLR